MIYLCRRFVQLCNDGGIATWFRPLGIRLKVSEKSIWEQVCMLVPDREVLCIPVVVVLNLVTGYSISD